MYSSNDLIDIIKEYVSKLDLQWFEKKENEFRRNKDYFLETETIQVADVKVFNNCGEDGEILGYETVEEKHQFNFKEYCSCYLPICNATGWGSYPADFYGSKDWHLEKSDNIDELANDLVKELADFLEDETDVTIVHKFISKQLDIIEREIATQKTILSSGTYGSVVDDFLRLCTYKLHKKFEKQLTRYNETVDCEDSLKFNLNQSELLSLLFLIHRAGFLNYTDNTPFLKFCSNHFLYRSDEGEFVKPTNIKTLQKQYSKIVTSQAPSSKQDLSINGLTYVSKELAAIIKKLR